ncbi:MAG: acyl carrier protein [Eubacterium sp.]|nr:acyl carrier protein [Eubacterium sp.]
MDYKKIIENLEEDILEVDEGTLQADTKLSELDEWDSLAKLALMAWARKEYDKILTAQQIREFVTVEDICNAVL